MSLAAAAAGDASAPAVQATDRTRPGARHRSPILCLPRCRPIRLRRPTRATTRRCSAMTHRRPPRSARRDRLAPTGGRRRPGRHSTAPFQAATEPRRAPLLVGGVIAVLAIAGVAAWLFMGRSNPAPPQPGVTVAPVLAPPPPRRQRRAADHHRGRARIGGRAGPGRRCRRFGRGGRRPPAATPALGPLGPPPTAAAPLPQLSDTPSGETPAAEAKRLAAEKRRDKADRDKAEEREAQRRQRAARSILRARPAQRRPGRAGAAPRRGRAAQSIERRRTGRTGAAQSAQARGVQELCAGRGAIAEAVCQSRECAAPGHANEPLCRRLREADERRRNL